MSVNMDALIEDNAQDSLLAFREWINGMVGDTESELFVPLSDVPATRAEMNRIADTDDVWTTVFVEGGVGWHNTDTDEVVFAGTPEGVPDDYVYVAPDEEVGDEYDTVTSPQGATYRSPSPTDDADGGDTNGDDESDGESPVPESGVRKTDSGAYVSADPDPEQDIERFMSDAEASEAIDETNAEPMGGFTVQRNLETYDVPDDDVWICGLTSVEFDADDGITKQDVVDFYEEYQEVLQEHTGVRIGGYHFESGEKISIDLSAALTDRDEAETLGEELDQESVFNPKVALGDGDWENGSVGTGGDGDSPLQDADPDDILQTLNELSSVTSEAAVVDMKEDSESAADDVFESPDGDRLSRRKIGYRGWKEGDVEADGDAFVVGGVRYEPVASDE